MAQLTNAAGMTPKMQKFAELYVASGGKNAEASARLAGYSDKGDAAHVRAHWLLHHPSVLTEITRLVKTRFQASLAFAAEKLEYLAANGGKDDAVQLRAVQALLEHGGLILAQYLRSDITVTHVVKSPRAQAAELRAVFAELAPDMGYQLVDEAKRDRFIAALANQRPAIDATDAEFTEGEPGDAMRPAAMIEHAERTGREGLEGVL